MVTIQLTQGADNHNVGDPIEMRFADSYAAKANECGSIDYLIGRRIEEAAPRLKKLAAKANRKVKA